MKWNNLNKLRVRKLAQIGIITLFTLGAISFSIQYKSYQDHLKNPASAAQTEQKSLIDKVGKLTKLPKEEKPTIATVADVSELKDQQFFVNAKEGYNVLIYSKANRRILYDPFNNKIINDGPVKL